MNSTYNREMQDAYLPTRAINITWLNHVDAALKKINSDACHLEAVIRLNQIIRDYFEELHNESEASLPRPVINAISNTLLLLEENLSESAAAKNVFAQIQADLNYAANDEHNNFIALAVEVIQNYFSYLPQMDLISFAAVSKHCRKMSMSLLQAKRINFSVPPTIISFKHLLAFDEIKELSHQGDRIVFFSKKHKTIRIQNIEDSTLFQELQWKSVPCLIKFTPNDQNLYCATPLKSYCYCLNSGKLIGYHHHLALAVKEIFPLVEGKCIAIITEERIESKWIKKQQIFMFDRGEKVQFKFELEVNTPFEQISHASLSPDGLSLLIVKQLIIFKSTALILDTRNGKVITTFFLRSTDELLVLWKHHFVVCYDSLPRWGVAKALSLWDTAKQKTVASLNLQVGDFSLRRFTRILRVAINNNLIACEVQLDYSDFSSGLINADLAIKKIIIVAIKYDQTRSPHPSLKQLCCLTIATGPAAVVDHPYFAFKNHVLLVDGVSYQFAYSQQALKLPEPHPFFIQQAAQVQPRLNSQSIKRPMSHFYSLKKMSPQIFDFFNVPSEMRSTQFICEAEGRSQHATRFNLFSLKNFIAVKSDAQCFASSSFQSN